MSRELDRDGNFLWDSQSELGCASGGMESGRQEPQMMKGRIQADVAGGIGK